jgi:hypothetical protein
MPANQPYDVTFWRAEVERADRLVSAAKGDWQDNLDYYSGKKKPDGVVNVNVDFYETEQKHPQLFFESPELQFTPGAGFDALAPGVVAFRKLVNVVLGSDYVDALETVQISLKRCMATSGRGPTIIGYHPTIQPVDQTPQPGAVLGLSRPVPVPVHEAYFWDEISDLKFLRPADFTSTNFDKAPWLGMRFRLPFKAAQQICTLPPDFEGTTTRDENVLTAGADTDETSSMAYVDGVLIWYKAALFDNDEIHPEIYRRHILIDGLEAYADKLNPETNDVDPLWASPYQTKLPNGRLRADSLIGNPIHVFTLRSVPDSAETPSDAKMRRELVKELNLFREQMLEERDINKPKFAYKASAYPPEAIAKIKIAMTGSLIGLPDEAWVGASDKPVGFAVLAQGSSPKQTYLANDYITRDIAKTSGIDSTGAGVDDGEGDETATKTAEIAKARNVRLDAERKRILRQYLKGVDKVAALVLRFCSDPLRVAEMIGPQDTAAYLQWRDVILQLGDPRPKFTAKPDSQIKLDAAMEFRLMLQLYEFAAKDPMVNRAPILQRMMELRGLDPGQVLAPEPPEKKPEPSVGFSFKGEDLNPLMPQYPHTIEVLQQVGFDVSPAAVADAQAGAKNQAEMQLLMAEQEAANAEAGPGQKKPAAHGGLAAKASPLSKHAAEQTGQRPGPSVQ